MTLSIAMTTVNKPLQITFHSVQKRNPCKSNEFVEISKKPAVRSPTFTIATVN
jgi:hypothetical protein